MAGIAAAVLIFANVSDGFRFAQANNEDKTEGQGAEEGGITAFPQLQRSITFVAGKTAPKSIEEFLGDTISVTVNEMETDRKKVESAAGGTSTSQETESAASRTSTSQETESAAGRTSTSQETEAAESQMSVDPEIKPEEQETTPSEGKKGDSEAEHAADGSSDTQTTVTKQVKITWKCPVPIFTKER